VTTSANSFVAEAASSTRLAVRLARRLAGTDVTVSSARRRGSETGAMLVQVAVAVLVLVGFLVFVVDYGVQWLARAQAQNAADAGAMAGALSRAFEEADGCPPKKKSGLTYQSARLSAESNQVWGEPGAVVVSYPTCPGFCGDVPGEGRCVRVDVHRNKEFSNPLPMVFGGVLGLKSQGVKATATGRVGDGNSTECMRPFAVADLWKDVPAAGSAGRYDHWVEEGGVAVELDPHDNYKPADPGSPGTGYTVWHDAGEAKVLEGGSDPMGDDPIVTGWTLPVRLPDGAGGYLSGAAEFGAAISSCHRPRVALGDYLPTEDSAMTGPTETGVEALIAQDPTASFNPVTKIVEGSCAPACAPLSPRVVPIIVFDIDDFQYRRAADDWSVCPAAGRCVKVVNILGFFVQEMSGSDVNGYLMTMRGELTAADPVVDWRASFLKTIRLIR
jgi:hypothetical protein